MPKIVLVHGGLKLGTGPEAAYAQRGDVVEVSDAALKDLDPNIWLTPEAWESAKKQAAAAAELEAEMARANAASGKTKKLPPKLGAAIDAEKKKLQAEAKAKKGEAPPAPPAAPPKK